MAPALWLIHHIDPWRLGFGYLLRLMYRHGRSRILLERVLRDAGRRSATGPNVLLRMAMGVVRTITSDLQISVRYACCSAAYRLGAAVARLKLGLVPGIPPSETDTAISDAGPTTGEN